MVDKRILDTEEEGSLCPACCAKRPRLHSTSLALSETDQRILENFFRKLVREEVERKLVLYNHKVYR
ncbi:unnamed protein product [Victoria cruziana]